MKQADIIPFNAVARKDVPSAHDDSHFDGFCKALVTVKTLLKCSSTEVLVSVNNLMAAELLTPREALALANFYGWDLTQ